MICKNPSCNNEIVGRRSDAKTCSRECNKRYYYLNNKDQWRESSFKRHYGITLEEYNILAEIQNHKCKICRKDCVRFEFLSVDHCHETGRIRGLLCQKCNHAIGLLGDDPNLLIRASEYIEGLL